jgi:hypothetical protein
MVQTVLAVFVILPVAVFVVWSAFRNGAVHVNDSLRTPLPLEAAEQRVFESLGSVPGATMTQVAPRQYAVVCKKSYPWAILFAVLLFPIGLLFLLLRQELVLNVRLAGDGGGATVQVAGRTQLRIADVVGTSLQASLAGS